MKHQEIFSMGNELIRVDRNNLDNCKINFSIYSTCTVLREIGDGKTKIHDDKKPEAI